MGTGGNSNRVEIVIPHQASQDRRPQFLLQQPKNHADDFLHVFNLSLNIEC
ncbi:hypothetical protein DPMN_100827 [Dreissena polymorpha]|uniref:Uncharacterized protein n=1 Tax=Dreissena polymorpha TaxID=45954 RepID=A0A9D4R8J7_DREPO|nr:hypothetical protein DPMN_100827 [Dreissena polymorpha]